jgi:hypothetical protein
MNPQLALKAALISPLASLPIIMIAAVLSISEQGFDWGVLLVLVFLTLGFLVVIYIFVFIVGLPIHYFLSVLKLNHWSIYLTFGLISATIYPIFNMVSRETQAPSQVIISLLIIAASSILVSYSFWYIAVRPHNKVKNYRTLRVLGRAEDARPF